MSVVVDSDLHTQDHGGFLHWSVVLQASQMGCCAVCRHAQAGGVQGLSKQLGTNECKRVSGVAKRFNVCKSLGIRTLE